MKFGPVPLDAARGAILAHSVQVAGRRLRKGTVLGPEEIDRLMMLEEIDGAGLPADLESLAIASPQFEAHW